MITDVYKAGDQLEILADGVSLGRTSLPIEADHTAGFDFAAANTEWLIGSCEFLAERTYLMSGFEDLSFNGGGIGAIRLDVSVSIVPVPTALFLFAPAVLSFFGLCCKRSAATAWHSKKYM